MRIIQEVRFAVRSLRKSPVMSATAIAVVALGIGANTALFTVFDAVLLRGLPYPDSGRIMEITRRFPGYGDIWAVTPTDFDFWRTQNHSFEAVSAQNYLPVLLNLTHGQEPEQLRGLPVTADYFRVLGVAPALGRTFTAAEDRPGSGHYVVLSHSSWSRLFARNPKVLGESLLLGGAPYTVVGVMPPGFDSPQHADMWIPLALAIDPADRANDYSVLARLGPGVTLESAQRDMQRVGDLFRATYPALINSDETVGVVSYHDYLVAGFRPALVVLLVAVGFVLAIVCANVANLLLARFTGRQHEIAVRRALGATLWTLIRQLLTESLLLAGAGAAAGLLLAAGIVPFLMTLTPTDLPQFVAPAINAPTILLAALLAVAVATLFTLAPIVSQAQAPASDALRQAGTRTTESAGSGRFRRLLVIAQVSISFMLLTGAGLLGKTFQRLTRVNPGFDAANVFITQMSIADPRFAESQVVAEMTDRAASRLEALPGVAAAGATDLPPLNGLYDLPFEIIGRPVDPNRTTDEKIRNVSPHYFAALGVPVVAGRAFSARDTKASTPAMLVNQAFADKYFPRGDPLGQQILIGRIMGPRFADSPRQIVGVVGNTRDQGLGSPAPPEMFLPLAQVPDAVMDGNRKEIPLNWVVRTRGGPAGLAPVIGRELTAATGLPAGEMMPVGRLVADSLARQRFSMVLLAIFAALALALGSMGLYGLIAYSVAQRTREIGIRCAVGAAPSDLVWLVFRDGMRLVLTGLAIGLAVSVWLSRFLRAMLYGVSPNDPIILIGVAIVLALTAALASLLPAWRAARIDPVLALRVE
jgi:putative ABC transport system permease protein